MKIDSYTVQQKAQSQYYKEETAIQTIEIVVRPKRELDRLELSNNKPLPVTEVEEKDPFELSDKDKEKIRMLRAFIKALTGKEIRFSQLGLDEEDDETKPKKKKRKQLIALSDQDIVALRIQQKHELYEYERMDFKSEGVVRTKDGREINFSLDLHMSREFYEKSELTLDVGLLQDPLVINLDATGVGFDDKELHIDLDLDGNVDTLQWLRSGSGFLALDKNENGEIDDGSELFGPQSGNGFAELAAYDSDQNGWIDESDSVFKSLKVWTLDSEGKEELITLKEAGVGAIYLGAVNSPYTLKQEGVTQGQITASSMYLKESGEAGVIHNINLRF